MKYYIVYRVDARYIAEVEADSQKEAVELAEEEFSNADFGEAEDIDGEAIYLEDEHGHRTDFLVN